MQLTNLIVFFWLLSFCLWKVESLNGTSIIEVWYGGRWGVWGKWQICPKGNRAEGFSLKVQRKQQFIFDDTSLNGIRLLCTDGSIITSEVGEDGTWFDAFLCESGFLTSFALRVLDYKLMRDNTAANNIKFKCTDGTELEGNGLEWGYYGSWSKSCKKGGICGIQTRVEKHFLFSDSTGLNDVKFFCCKN